MEYNELLQTILEKCNITLDTVDVITDPVVAVNTLRNAMEDVMIIIEMQLEREEDE